MTMYQSFNYLRFPFSFVKLISFQFRLQLNMDATDYLRNALNLTIFGTGYGLKKLREPVNKTDWVSHGRPAVVNAYYSPLENSIRNFLFINSVYTKIYLCVVLFHVLEFPAGILQGAFFGKDRPMYLNYAAIGWVIGHEITHGFDDQVTFVE